MRYEWDEAKAAANLGKHGVAFEDVVDFVWEVSVETIDYRRDYKESRCVATSAIRGRLHVLVFTRREYNVRVVSLRKANGREIRNYEEVRKKT